MPTPVTMIGLTGSIGSGCSYIYEEFLKNSGYKLKRLSDSLRSEYRRQHPEVGAADIIPTRDLQQFGNYLRESKGADVLVTLALQEIEQEAAADQKWVVDSIKNPAEIRALEAFTPRFS